MERNLRHLPPLSALRAFEAVGRRASLSAAATELSVTHGAVSKQIKTLEAALGVRLARRVGSGLELTPEGRRLFAQLTKAFDALDGAVRSLDREKYEGNLTISCMPALAQAWLIPNLSRFLDLYPNIELTVLPPSAVGEPMREADLSILYGRPHWPDRKVRLLRSLEIFPVCAPSLQSGEAPPRTISDLAQHTLIDAPDGTHWRDFFIVHEADPPSARRTLRFHDFTQCLTAARAGLGVAIGDDVTAARELASGELVRPLRETTRRQNIAYYLVSPNDRPASAAARAFGEWASAELGASHDRA